MVFALHVFASCVLFAEINGATQDIRLAENNRASHSFTTRMPKALIKTVGKAFLPVDIETEEESEAGRERKLQSRHLMSALQALLHILESHPRLAALMASRAALTPLLACINPLCK